MRRHSGSRRRARRRGTRTNAARTPAGGKEPLAAALNRERTIEADCGRAIIRFDQFELRRGTMDRCGTRLTVSAAGLSLCSADVCTQRRFPPVGLNPSAAPCIRTQSLGRAVMSSLIIITVSCCCDRRHRRRTSALQIVPVGEFD